MQRTAGGFNARTQLGTSLLSQEATGNLLFRRATRRYEKPCCTSFFPSTSCSGAYSPSMPTERSRFLTTAAQIFQCISSPATPCGQQLTSNPELQTSNSSPSSRLSSLSLLLELGNGNICTSSRDFAMKASKCPLGCPRVSSGKSGSWRWVWGFLKNKCPLARKGGDSL